MEKVKEIWKKLKYWQKGGIAFCVLHFFVLSITFLIMFSEYCTGDCALLIIIPEAFPALLSMAIKNLSSSYFDPWRFHPNVVVVSYIYGTIVYFILGISIGSLIDKKIERRKK